MVQSMKRKGPMQPMLNQKAYSISTLRSMRKIDNKVERPSEVSVPVQPSVCPFTIPNSIPTSLESNGHIKEPIPSSSSSSHVEKPYEPKAPFPQALNSTPFPRQKGKINDMMEVFKQIKINCPLLDAIQQIPPYAKFLKDLCTQKRKNKGPSPKKVLLMEQVNSIIKLNTPPKFKDPGALTISCTIGNHEVKRALLDLGASVNVIPYSVYLQLGLGNLKPTSVIIQLADKSTKQPRGIVEDILIKVDKFYFPVDFVVLDTEPVPNSTNYIPIILGRPFLATANATINCRFDIMDISFGNMMVKLNVFNTSQHPIDEGECFMVNVLDELVEEAIPSEDPFEACLSHFNIDAFDIESFIYEVNSLMDFMAILDFSPWKNSKEPLPPIASTLSYQEEKEVASSPMANPIYEDIPCNTEHEVIEATLVNEEKVINVEIDKKDEEIEFPNNLTEYLKNIALSSARPLIIDFIFKTLDERKQIASSIISFQIILLGDVFIVVKEDPLGKINKRINEDVLYPVFYS
ncbi:uncharacterized protein LOC132267055 [Cornus florida]|uniref:uncharacterized protein LOC132267055 n=1 Tax=Cornus florida TaxID=4283 RepID=UPI00289E775F|nr:uncharacterized protein LOC132267055 [Cornus florida]